MNWPQSVDLYDSKGTAKPEAGGVGEKDFEFLLIPRAPGKVTLPPLEFSYFDPVKKSYVTKTTDPIDITVLDPLPGSAILPPVTKNVAPQASSGNPSAMHPLKPLTDVSAPGQGHGQPLWRWLYWLCTLAIVAFCGIVAVDFTRKAREGSKRRMEAKAKAQKSDLDYLRARAKSAMDGASWREVTETYEFLMEALLNAIDRAHDVGARSLPRAELERLLVEERGLPGQVWQKISAVLEYGELVRFASSAGAVSEQSARRELARWIDEADSAIQMLKAR